MAAKISESILSSFETSVSSEHFTILPSLSLDPVIIPIPAGGTSEVAWLGVDQEGDIVPAQENVQFSEAMTDIDGIYYVVKVQLATVGLPVSPNTEVVEVI
ncbi:MAG: hypothetical protein AAF357_09925, partial [Verrucomicrobiota bacterium]